MLHRTDRQVRLHPKPTIGSLTPLNYRVRCAVHGRMTVAPNRHFEIGDSGGNVSESGRHWLEAPEADALRRLSRSQQLRSCFSMRHSNSRSRLSRVDFVRDLEWRCRRVEEPRIPSRSPVARAEPRSCCARRLGSGYLHLPWAFPAADVRHIGHQRQGQTRHVERFRRPIRDLCESGADAWTTRLKCVGRTPGALRVTGGVIAWPSRADGQGPYEPLTSGGGKRSEPQFPWKNGIVHGTTACT
jgi:hypothetical protein